jgi:hypothetical protein
MGFFSNLKNSITGGAAEVQVEAPQTLARGGSAAIRIRAVAKANASVSAVYVLVRASENAKLRDTDYADGKSRTETVHGYKVTYETRIAIAGPQQLQEGQTYQWEGVLQLPAAANPSFDGQMINHVWELQAGLDMKGNDPDSGWQSIQVS